jgi:hypothetical protein
MGRWVQAGSLRVGVGGHAVAQAAVGRQLQQADGKELQHLACVVLVGHAAGGRVFLLVAAHVEIHTHAGRERHRFEQAAVVAKGVGFQHVHVGRGQEAAPGHGQAGHRDDEDLAEGQRDTLAQQVGRRDQLAPQRVVGAREAVDVGCIHVTVGAHPVGVALGAGLQELLVQPGAVPDGLHAGDLRVAGREAGLGQEARGFGRCRRCRRCRWRRWRRRWW